MAMKRSGKNYRIDSRFNSEWHESVYDAKLLEREKQKKTAKDKHREWLELNGLDASGIAEKRRVIKWT